VCLVMGSKNKLLKIACCLQKWKALVTAFIYHVSVELLSAEGQYKIMPPYSRDVVSQRHTPTLRLTGLCVGIFMFTHFARSEPFPLLCDVTEFHVVGSVQSAHNLQTENFCSFIQLFTAFVQQFKERCCTVRLFTLNALYCAWFCLEKWFARVCRMACERLIFILLTKDAFLSVT